uniref:RING-type domain-containing protein n=1 Tax=Kalanchoe fedtschenkoi TaxID=63787 RepID=A0A7N1A2W4_KALFE
MAYLIHRRLLSTATTTNSSSSVVAEAPEALVTVESDFVVIFAALLCALICLLGLIAVARCACLRRGGPSSSASAANKGLKKKILHSFPKFAYDSSSRSFSAQDCPICLAEFADGDEIRVLPQCGHGFHAGCVDTWLGSHSSCPSCRRILVGSRCQKCGHFPAEIQMKAREDAAAVAGPGPSAPLPFLP